MLKKAVQLAKQLKTPTLNAGVRWSGLLWLWRYMHRSHVIVLMIHGTMDGDSPSKWTPLRDRISPKHLDKVLRVLAPRYRFVSLDEAVAIVAGKKPSRRAMVVTFDDGYKNNITHALPLLQRYGVPATIFLPTGNIDSQKPFWYDRIDYALQAAKIQQLECRLDSMTLLLRGADREQLRHSFEELRTKAKGMRCTEEEMVQRLEPLAEELERKSQSRLCDTMADDPWAGFLTWSEARAAQTSGVQFGSHTVDHVALGTADRPSICDQLTRSKETLERELGTPCRQIAYPYGSFSPLVEELTRSCGYSAGVTTEVGTNPPGTDPIALRRIHVPVHGNETEILAIVSGLYPALWRMKDQIRAWLGRLPGFAGAHEKSAAAEL
jgi:peptidoglycan/xylan/chitin deacetylase (PgdA/CDA1 family)